MLANPDWEKDLLLDLSKPSLKALSYILRHHELWPKEFSWYYGSCDRCAMGLTFQIWSDYIRAPVTEDIFRSFGIDIETTRHLFTSEYDNKWYSDVTPEMVADRIDEYINSQ